MNESEKLIEELKNLGFLVVTENNKDFYSYHKSRLVGISHTLNDAWQLCEWSRRNTLSKTR